MKKYQLVNFLDSYDTILFDMDGVITSEQAYWDAAALTVYEMYYGKSYYGNDDFSAKYISDNLKEIRSKVFCSDSIIRLVKNKGVNSNWDLAYTVLGSALLIGENADFNDIYTAIDAFGDDAFTLYSAISEKLAEKFGKEKSHFERLGPFWQEITSCFQEWYLGDELFKQIYNRSLILPSKIGFISNEEPLVDKARLLTMLSLMRDKGIRLGVGTGRPKAESVPVLKQWGALSFFAEDSVITYNDVTDAEKELRKKGIDTNLPKPHPYMFLKGCLGNNVSDEDIINGNFDPAPLKRTLVIGDAGADLFAARSAGCDFLAVLTGVHGADAKPFFEKEKSNYILNNVLELLTEKE